MAKPKLIEADFRIGSDYVKCYIMIKSVLMMEEKITARVKLIVFSRVYTRCEFYSEY